jgi:hypothetical protein
MTRPEVWTRAAAVGSQRLTTWAMARPNDIWACVFSESQDFDA